MTPSEERARWEEELEWQSLETERIARTPFLNDWLTSFQQWRREFKNEALSTDELEIVAREQGYRSWRAYSQSLDHQERALQLFVRDAVLQGFWKYLREQDRRNGEFAYSSANGGYPATILRAIEDWYRAPKFTRSELIAHHRKIARLADELLLLLGQVTPSAQYADRYSAVHVDASRIDAVVSAIDRLNRWRGDTVTRMAETLEDYRKANLVRELIAESGITTVSVIQGLRAACMRDPFYDLLPRKIRAPEAIKTYFIVKLSRGASLSMTPVPNQILADVVGRLTNTDCSADDVRKAAKHSEAVSLRESQRMLAAEHSKGRRVGNLPRKKGA